MSARFDVVGRLGLGGMGVVYEVLDRERGTRLALKTLRAPEGDAIVRLKHEFRALQDLAHPNLVTLGELIEEDGRWFFTMELIPGTDFLGWVRPGRGAGAGEARTGRDDLAYEHTATSASQLGIGTPPPTATAPRAAGSAPAPASAPPTAASPTAASPATAPPAPAAAAAAPGTLDEARLRAALAQLAAGLGALHGARMVHRDIKPGNVRVTPEGRVVLLDFGLVAPLSAGAAGDARADSRIVGTAAYMAPEQAAGSPATPAADLYSVGVMLFEALTGQVPFTGPPLEVLAAKQRGDGPAPSSIVAGVPPELDSLCRELLAREPARRPSAAAVLARLGEKRPTLARSSASFEAPFVGRAAELTALAEAFAEVRAGRQVTVLVEGRSGLGKSTLVDRALARLADAAPDLVVLRGRCHERESVPYKTVDGVIDALAAHLVRLPAATTAALLPAEADRLATAFPQLRQVPTLARAVRSTSFIDPIEQRTRLFAAMRQLFAALARRAPLVVAIDDLQWGDADGQQLLAELTRAPQAPPFLLVATLRDDAPARARELPGEVRRLVLGPLAPGEAGALAARLCAAAELPAALADELARDAGGHPLFIDELVRRAAAGGARGAAAARLDDALRERAAGLPEAARELLDVVALAGGPLALATVARAAGVEAGELWKPLAELRAARFVRSTGSRADDHVEPWHDRVREAVVAALPGDKARALHERLAVALEGEARPDPEALALSWRAAGNPDRAAQHAVVAARRAAAALAFERATAWYRAALELGAPLGEGLGSILAALGDALAALGRGAEAADAYLEAARGASRGDALELRRRAAEVRLRIGDFDEGLPLLAQVLEPVGLTLPGSPNAALASLIWGRARLALRGLDFTLRDASQIAPETLIHVDLCWSAAVCLGVCNFIYGADFQTRHLRLALDAGEPYRVARALAVEAAFAATGGRPAVDKVAKLLARARPLAETARSDHAIGLCDAVTGLAAYQVGEFSRALVHVDRAGAYLRERCADVNWEIAIAHFYCTLSLWWSGRWAELGRRFPPVLEEAKRRGDKFASTLLACTTFLERLAADDPDGADARIEGALADWSNEGFHIQHLLALLCQGEIMLYRGQIARAHALCEARWPAMQRSLLLRIPNNRWTLGDMRARVALALARSLPPGGQRRRLLGGVRAAVRAMRREDTPWADVLAAGLLAGLAHAEGDAGRAAERFDEAAALAARADMAAHAAAFAVRAAELAPTPARRSAAEGGMVYLRAQGVVAPQKMIARLAP